MKLSLAESGAPAPKAPVPKLTGKSMSKAKRDAQAAAAAEAIAAAEKREAEMEAARAAALNRGLRIPIKLQRRFVADGLEAEVEVVAESTRPPKPVVGAEAVECDLAAATFELVLEILRLGYPPRLVEQAFSKFSGTKASPLIDAAGRHVARA